MLRTRFVTTIRRSTITSYLLFILALAMIALPIKADRSTSAAAATEIRQGAAGCNGASFAQPGGSPVGVGVSPEPVREADFNLDGKPDLAVANIDSNNVTILLGNGGGGFAQPAGSPVAAGSTPASMAVGDFNLDGKPDLAIGIFNDASVTILLGDGSGGFTQAPGSPVGVGFLPRSVAVGDFNLDGKPDLAAANQGSDSLTILLGNGSGGFAQAAGSPIGVGSHPFSLAIGDFNRDGKADVAVANSNSDSVSILLGNGIGGFTQPAGSPVGVGSFPDSIAAGDFNLDGKSDLVVTNFSSNNVTILLGDGGGGFSEPAGSPVGSGIHPQSVRIGDFNLDGNPDLAMANPGSNNVTVLFGDGSGGFSEPAGSPLSAESAPSALAVQDFNLDGKPDLAVVNRVSNNVTILLNTCDAFPCSGIGFIQPAGSPVSAGVHPRSVATADLNLDGKPDLAVANEASHNVTILLGNGNGGFTQPAGSPVGVGTQPVSLSAGDFNLDGKPDLAVVNAFSSNATILLGNGSGGFAEAAGSPIGVGINPLSVALGDFNLDGKPDLAVANSGSDNVMILLGNGTGGFTGSIVGAETAPAAVAAGDFNIDGKPDLAVANNASNNITILLGNGTGAFSQPAGSPIGAGNTPVSIAVGDFNIDGKSDLAVANHNPGSVTILLGNGSGGFTQPAGSPVGAGALPLSVAVGDFNRDGKPDLAVANDLVSNNVTILLGNGSGGFSQPAGSPLAAGSFPFFVAVGDFNLDGKGDLAVANLISDDVTILLNACGGNTSPTSCLQDETNGNFMSFDSQTGDYLFVVCSQGLQVSGRGKSNTPRMDVRSAWLT